MNKKRSSSLRKQAISSGKVARRRRSSPRAKRSLDDEKKAIAKAKTTTPADFPAEAMQFLKHPPPPDVAIMHIHAAGDDAYTVLGGHVARSLPFTEPRSVPDLSLAEMVQDKCEEKMELPLRIKQYVTEFSRLNFKIRDWLNRLRRKYGNPFTLLIIDHTDFEIPWEMLKLSRRKEYLGALLTTARWQRVETWDEGTWLLNFEPDECYGHVMSYINHAELKHTALELEILTTLNSIQYADIQHFRQQLKQNKAGVGLIYMACHGIWGKNLYEMALGAQYDKQQQLSLWELYDCDLQLLSGSQAIVFINACHSGRSRTEPRRLRDGLRRGFTELFLSQGARGVIGTLGGVGDTHAAQIGRQLIHAVQQSPNLSIAELLRQLRAQVVADLSDKSSDKELLEFIYTFMYVYYGNPRTRLRLVRREE